MDEEDDNPTDMPIAQKKARHDSPTDICIICNKNTFHVELTRPKDNNSWQTLLDAAKIRNFYPILQYESSSNIPNIGYHRDCRADFTHRKVLKSLVKKVTVSSDNIDEPRKSSRELVDTKSRVYSETCIFCEKQTKYFKKTRTREPLIKSCELRADERIRATALHKMDTKILALTARELVAAEAHYHKTCYRIYTKIDSNVPTADPTDNITIDAKTYSDAECNAYKLLFDYIRETVFDKPRVIPMTVLTVKLVDFMTSFGIMSVRNFTKKHIRRKVETEFGDSIHIFSGDNGRLLLVPDNLSVEHLAKENFKLSEELQSLRERNTDNLNMLDMTAKFLRSEIQKIEFNKSWPPMPEELNEEYISIPSPLSRFIQILLCGTSSEDKASAKVKRLVSSFSQDLVYAVSGGVIKTPKQILLPWSVKTLTGNVEIIKMLNRLGQGISLSSLQEIDTSLCMQKITKQDNQGVVLPSNIYPCVPTTLAFDNIDRIEETLSGGGTSHRVNGIVIQPQVSTAQPLIIRDTLTKDKKRSIPPTTPVSLQYTAGNRCGPPPLIGSFVSDNVTTEADVKLAHNTNIVWSMVRQCDTTQQKMTSWTGFNIQIRNHIKVCMDTISYLPTINAPATHLATAYEILKRAKNIAETLHVDDIVCVFDQALYAKAAEVAWKHQEQFNMIVLRMGVFHTLCNLLSIIGKRFSDAGLRDIAVESGVIAEGSITSVLDGRKYNRGIRLHKIIYESLMRLAWQEFYPWLEENHPEDMAQLNLTIKDIKELYDDTCHESMNRVLLNPSCIRILKLFDEFIDSLRTNCGSLSAFWVSYLDLVEIMLGLLRSSREGNWHLHLYTIRSMIPWCFAYDRQNYAKYLSVYHSQMTALPEEHPQIYTHFTGGGFSVQMGKDNPFGRIPVDQTIEETINKDTQTAGGTKGFSTKPSAVSKYYLNAEYRSTALKQLRSVIEVDSPHNIHSDLQPSRVKKDETDVQSVVELLQTSWTNPFQNNPCDIINLSTGTTAPPDISNDLLLAHESGQKNYQAFYHDRLQNRSKAFYDRLPKLKLKTFTDMRKQQSAKTANKETILKADHRLFGKMILVTDWKSPDKLHKLNGKIMYVTCGENCYKLTETDISEVDELRSTHEEADTRMLLHAKHAAEYYNDVILVADDTDILIICLAFSTNIQCHLYMQCGTKVRQRLIDITKLTSAIGADVCASLIGLHCYTGCDTISSFSGQGKLGALKLVINNKKFRDALATLGKNWALSSELYDLLQEFTCRLYCPKSTTCDIKELRYELFRDKKGSIESSQLPPCGDSLYQHALRANYQAGIWHRSLVSCPDIPRPDDDHGWILDAGDKLIVKWMSGSPAPDAVLNLLSCTCKRICKLPQCQCLENRLKCTEACTLQECTNMCNDDEEGGLSSSDDDTDDDES